MKTVLTMFYRFLKHLNPKLLLSTWLRGRGQRFFAVSLFFCIVPGGFAQEFAPFFQQFSQNEHPGHRQNWCVESTSSGLWLVCNSEGILTFDGSEWQIIRNENDSRIRQLRVDEAQERIYTGFDNQLGFYYIGADQQWQFKNFHSAQAPQFAAVNKVELLGSQIVFLTDHWLFLLDEKEELSWYKISEAQTQQMAVVGQQVLIFDPTVGAQSFDLKTKQLTRHPGFESLRGRYVLSVDAIDADTLILGTFNQDLFLWKNGKIAPFPFRHQQMNYAITVIDKEHIAVGTARQGVFIVNQAGEVIRHFNDNTGLKDKAIIDLSFDPISQSLLVVTHQSGVVQISHPLTVGQIQLDDAIDSVSASTVIGDRAYFGVIGGLDNSHLAYSEIKRGELSPLRVLKAGTYVSHVTAYQEQLLVTTDHRLMIYDTDNKLRFDESLVEKQVNESYTLGLESDNAALALFADKLFRVDMTNNEVSMNENVIQLQANAATLLEHADSIWLGTSTQQVIRLRKKGSWPNFEQTLFDRSHGLPVGNIQPVLIDGQLFFASSKQGLFYFNETQQRFFQDEKLLPENHRNLTFFEMTQQDNILVNFERDNDNRSILTRITTQGPNEQAEVDFNFLPHLTEKQVMSLHLTTDKSLLIGGFESLFLVNSLNSFSVPTPEEAPKLRLKRISHGEKTIFFNGLMTARQDRLQLARTQRKLSVAVELVDTRPNLKAWYRFYDGESWSAWSEQNVLHLNLGRPGDSNIVVEARTQYGEEPVVLNVPMHVPAFWYETLVAKIAIVAAFLVLCFFALRYYVAWRMQRVEAEKARLEAVVSERTQTIKQQSDKLVSLEKSRNKIFANISHEFRTPLSLILSPIEQILTKEQADGQGERKHLKVAYDNAHRLLNLVNQILDVNRIEQQSIQLNRAHYNFSEFVLTLVSNFDSVLEQEDIVCDTSAVQGNVIWDFDAYYMERVIFNLLSNAIKFSGRPGLISLILSCRDGQIELAVKDNGQGMGDADKARVFERYFQGESGFHNVKPGTGIGLSFVKELVGLHQGSIRCDSELGIGTTFTLSFPVTEQAVNKVDLLPPIDFVASQKVTPIHEAKKLRAVDVAVTQDVDTSANHSDDGQSLLLVEDNAELAEFILNLFSGQYRVFHANNGVEGLRMAREILPDVIVSDIMMPKMDGFELVDHLKNDSHTNFIPVLLLTAKTNKPDTVKALNSGADDYLTKPFHNEELIARVNGLIKSREILKQRYLASDAKLGSAPAARNPVMHNQINRRHKDYSLYQSAVEVVMKNLSNPDFNVKELTSELAMTRSSFYRRLNHVIPVSPQQLIRDVRLSEAYYLLKENYGNVSEVAYAVGFNSIAYFSRCFKEEFNCTPSQLICQSA